jgi:uncharacterized damage-inducible protein DinB
MATEATATTPGGNTFAQTFPSDSKHPGGLWIKNYFIELADYNIWANNIIIEWLLQIDDQQWEQTISSSFPSIKKTAVHIASAEKIWIDFWKNTPNPVYLSKEFQGTKNDLIATWKEASAGMKHFIEEYPEENCQQPVRFKKPNGEEGQIAFSRTFPHIINHSTYHRGQLVTMMHQTGFKKLRSTDLFTYYHMMQQD